MSSARERREFVERILATPIVTFDTLGTMAALRPCSDDELLRILTIAEMVARDATQTAQLARDELRRRRH